MNECLPAAVVSDLIGSIYDCAIDPSLWETTLCRIAGALDCGKALLSLNDLRRDRSLINKSAGWEPRWREEREKHLPEIHGALSQWLCRCPGEDEPFVASQLLAPEHLAASAYVRNCLAPQGITDVAHFFLMRTDEHFSELALFRQAPQGAIANREIELGKMLLPHLRRAVTISRLLDIKTVAAATLEASLDTLATAVLLVSHEMRIVHTNRAAETVLQSGDPLLSHNGVLKLRAPGAAAALTVAVAQAAADERAIGRKGLGVPVNDACGRPCLLHVLPLRHGELRTGLMPKAAAAIFVASAASNPPTSIAAVKALFDLTTAEVTVLERLLAGDAPAGIAAGLGITLATVKTHLQHIFDKTGVRRQADLVALVVSFSLPLLAAPGKCLPKPAQQ